MADKRISQLIERVDIANNDVLPIVASGATTTNKVTVSTLQDWMQDNLDVGVTSVGLSMPSAFVVSNSPVTGSGNISVTGAGSVSQYIRGDGSLADFPSGGGGGGSSVNYYLNGSVSQGTIGGIAYQEMNKVPVLGAGTDFTIASDGYIASFITDAGDPALLQIPAGNWNFETYLQASSGGGTPTFYIELYKVDSGGTATLIATSSATPELIAFGTVTTAYFSSLAVPETILTLTDRLALRYYVSHSGRTITLHTENATLCQIITTFTTGLTALNGLTAQVQNFATGTSGTDFNISSSVSTHTFNLPNASATARGVVSTGNQTFAGIKTFNSTIVAGQEVQIVQVGTALPIFIKNISGTFLTAIGSNGIGFNGSNNIYFAGSNKLGGVIAWNNTDNRTYTLQDASGTLAFTSDLGNYIQGSGTADFVPKFTADRTIANSAIRDTTSTVVISKNVSVDNGAGQSINLTPASGGTTNRIETTGTLPLAIITSGASITLAAGGTIPQITLASSGAATFSSSVTAIQGNFFQTSSSGLAIQIRNRNANQTWGLVVDTDAVDDKNLGIWTGSQYALKLNATSGAATFSSSVQTNRLKLVESTYGTNYTIYTGVDNTNSIGIYNETSGVYNIKLASTGAATFSSSVGVGGAAIGLNGINIPNQNYLAWYVSGTSGAQNVAIRGNGQNLEFSSGGGLTMTMDASQRVGIGTASPVAALDIQFGSSSSDNQFRIRKSDTLTTFLVRGDGAVFASGVYGFTTGSAANVVVFSDGSLQRSTSSIKYKKNVENYSKGLEEVMLLRPVTYEGISESDEGKTFAGLIAEEVHDLGLNEFVQYAEDGSPDALSYSNMVSLLVKAIQELKTEIDSLKNQMQ